MADWSNPDVHKWGGLAEDLARICDAYLTHLEAVQETALAKDSLGIDICPRAGWTRYFRIQPLSLASSSAVSLVLKQVEIHDQHAVLPKILVANQICARKNPPNRSACPVENDLRVGPRSSSTQTKLSEHEADRGEAQEG
jgi:hypothetical protein